MSFKRKFFPAAQAETLGPRTVRVVASTGAVDRSGEQVVPGGIDLSGFLANPVILWQHDPDHPIGTASNVMKTAAGLQMDIEFASEGLSKKADEICGLVKSGVLRGVSIGFDPIESEPMQPGKFSGPQRYLRVELMEASIVSIPANSDAAVIQRSFSPSVLREGKTLSAATQAALEEAMGHMSDAIEHHSNAHGSMQKFKSICTALIQVSDGLDASGGASDGKAYLPRAQREAVAAELRRIEPFSRYPEHLRGHSEAHYAARATFDFNKSVGIK